MTKTTPTPPAQSALPAQTMLEERLLKVIHTRTDQQALLNTLRMVRTAHPAPEVEKILNDALLSHSELINFAFETSNAKEHQQKVEAIQALERATEQLSSTQLTISYQPTTAQAGELVGFLRQNVNPNAIIDLKIESELGVGFVLDFGGQRISNSLNQLLMTKISAKSQKSQGGQKKS